MRRPTHRTGGAAIAGAVLMALAALGGCENSDPVAPEDSTITVSANPQTVVTPGGAAGSAEITAIIRSKNGTRLPDQEVVFDSTGGSLDPRAGSIILTDDDGVALCTLTTTSAATITARSGSISGTTQVQTVTADLTTFLLDVSPGTDINSCNDVFIFTATVLDVNGDPVPGVRVIFEEDNIPLTYNGQFDPASGQVTSNNQGEARVTWRPGNDCTTFCVSGICEVTITATDITDSFASAPVTLNDNVP